MSDKNTETAIDLTKRVEAIATKTFPNRKEGEKFLVSQHLVQDLKAKGFIK